MSFGLDASGKVLTDFAGGSDYLYKIIHQDDGKILVAGYAYNGKNYDFALARYLNNGTLDPNFGVNGKVLTDFSANTDSIEQVILQEDGTIIVAGRTVNGLQSDFALARYLNNGILDPNFGVNGKVVTDFAFGADYLYQLTIQEDNKILVAGYANNNSDRDFALARYLNDGTLDPSFGGDGKVLTDFTGGADEIYQLILQNNGKILAAGKSYQQGSKYNFALARYHSDGTLDTNFSGDGKVVTDFVDLNDGITQLILQDDGKILAGGYRSTATGYKFALARYLSNGTLDNSFSGDGKLSTNFKGGYDHLNQVIIQENGKILAAGYANNGDSKADFALVRYHDDGTLDTSFGENGIVLTNLGDFNDSISQLIRQNDGKILVAGYAYNKSTDNDFALARYHSNGTLDLSFGADGKVMTDFVGNNDSISQIILQNDGKILAAGRVKNGFYTDFALARYNSNGTLDIYSSPTDIILSSNTVDENQAPLTLVGILSTIDPDLGETYTYNLVAGSGDADNSSFLIEDNLLKTASSFDFETKNHYSIRIETNDGNGGIYQEEFIIIVNDLSETITPTQGNDIIKGDDNQNTIKALIGNDKVYGRGAADNLDGGEGNDQLFGQKGNDTLFGRAGNDILNGGSGADLLAGGANNDVYIVDSLDTVMEAPLAGNDTIKSKESYFLDDNFERLLLGGSDKLNATGNNQRNVIKGNSGNNILKGKANHDKLFGKAGNDTLIGGKGNDQLTGGAGKDKLIGGKGADDFIFTSPNDKLNIIQDFKPGQGDKIQLNATGFDGELNFLEDLVVGTAPVDKFDRLIYNTTINKHGHLFYDPDGTGSASQLQIANFIGSPALNAHDFEII